MNVYHPNQLANAETLGGSLPFELYAGEKELVDAHDMVAPDTEVAQYTVLGRVTDTGLLVPHNPAGEDGSEVIVGVAMQAVTTGDDPISLPYRVSAFFNHDALVWHDDVDTLEKRKAAVQGTEIQVGTVYGTTL